MFGIKRTFFPVDFRRANVWGVADNEITRGNLIKDEITTYQPVLNKRTRLLARTPLAHKNVNNSAPCRFKGFRVDIIPAYRVGKLGPFTVPRHQFISQSFCNCSKECATTAGRFDHHLVHNAHSGSVSGNIQNQIDNPAFRIHNTVMLSRHATPVCDLER